MTNDSTTTARVTAARVYSYDTADVLDGAPSAALVEASLAAGDTGAVAAYRDEQGIWQHVADSMVGHYGHLGETVVTVYVEADDADGGAPDPVAWAEDIDLAEVAGGDIVGVVATWRAIEHADERTRVERESVSVWIEGDYPAEIGALDVDDREEWKRDAIDAVIAALYEAAEDAPPPIVEIDFDSIELFEPELDDGEEYDAEALSHCIGLDVTIDGRAVRIGCCVGAHDSDHGTVRAAGGGVRPFCDAWWTDSGDWQDVPAGAVDAVLEALREHAWALYCRACEEVGAGRPSC